MNGRNGKVKRKCARSVDETEMLRLYKTGISMQEVARIMGLSAGCVFNHLKALGEARSRREALLGRHHTKETIEKIRAANKNKKLSEEAKKQISERNKLHGPGHTKLRADGYIAVYYPEHQSASKDGYVMQHRLIMEQNIGRALQPGEVVHHKNHIRTDNSISNLLLMSASEHMTMHMKERYSERRRLKLTR